MQSVDWFAAIFLLSMIPPIGLIGTFVLDRFGLRAGLLAATAFNAIGALVRSLSLVPFPLPDNLEPARPLIEFYAVLFGQFVIALAQPFVLFASTRLANTWFAEDQVSASFCLYSMYLLFYLTRYYSLFANKLMYRIFVQSAQLPT